MKKISVIIPIYNTEKYISECLESIINQTYTNLEIILINDGSTDNSLSICNNYAQKDKRIQVISQRNQGLSCARNAGLNISTGDLISFVDSDDKLDLNTYRNNIEYFNQYPTLDFIQIPTIWHWLSPNACSDKTSFQLINEHNLFEYLFKNIINDSCCTKIFNARIKDWIKFKKGSYFEDALMLYNIIDKGISKAIISDKGCYYYRYTNGSIIHQEWSAKKWGDYFDVLLPFYFKAKSMSINQDTIIRYYIDHFWKIRKVKRLYADNTEKERLAHLLKESKIPNKELWKFIFNRHVRLSYKRRALSLLHKDLYSRIIPLLQSKD